MDGARYEGFCLSQTQEKITLVNPRYNIDAKNGERIFLKVISKGALSHYEYQWWEQGDSRMMSMYLLKKQGDDYFIRANQGFLGLKRKVLIVYFQDCLELQNRIKEKQIKDVAELADFYNTGCPN